MGYNNFNVALYCPVGNLNAIGSLDKFDKIFRFFEKHLHFDKIYLESYRSGEWIDRDKIIKLKEFFENRGMKVSGGITTTDRDNHDEFGFISLCYTNESHRERLKSIVEMTAGIFDEIILDDFYFTNCKCESCIQAKGNRSWSEFRTQLMKEVSEQLVLAPAKRVNPKVNMIIKYPNWYECYQETGYNLKDEPGLFDMIYAGTETRDPLYTQQHLPKYLSYFIMRYLENVKPGKNGGGWFDPFECRGNLNYYAEQAYLTLYAKAREVTLFCLGALLEKNGEIYVPLAGHIFDAMDEFTGKLGNPVGTACYIPYHSNGEDYLHNYVGMLGIPLEPYPEYPADSRKIFLTESAAADPCIISKINKSLLDGSDVIVTSGFVKAMTGKGFENLANIRWTGRKALVKRYALSSNGFNLDNVADSDKTVLLPWMGMATNDTWVLAEGLGEDNNIPVLMAVNYGKGHLYILTIPDDFGDLYHYPQEVLLLARSVLSSNSPVILDTVAKIGLFTYDNDTFVVESFLPQPNDVKIIVNKPDAKLLNLISGKETTGIDEGSSTVFIETIQQSTYKVFKCI
jgi:hypothetical protein